MLKQATTANASEVSDAGTRPGAMRLWIRAVTTASGAVLALVLIVSLCGLIREGRGDDVTLAVGLVLVVGSAGALLKARAVYQQVSRLSAMALQVALAGDFFFLILAFAGGGLFVVAGNDWKFRGVEDFAVSFATATLIFLVASSAVIAQDAAASAASPASPGAAGGAQSSDPATTGGSPSP